MSRALISAHGQLLPSSARAPRGIPTLSPCHAMTDSTTAAPVALEPWDKCMRLARELLMVGDDGSDLTLQYLRILFEGGLPRTERPRRVLVVGAGIAGLL